eukprot:m.90651 g.90651  ORF g.90651 m.90651 type:complete len:315 (+) comp9872_c0_seq1:2859-3803(+)
MNRIKCVFVCARSNQSCVSFLDTATARRGDTKQFGFMRVHRHCDVTAWCWDGLRSPHIVHTGCCRVTAVAKEISQRHRLLRRRLVVHVDNGHRHAAIRQLAAPHQHPRVTLAVAFPSRDEHGRRQRGYILVDTNSVFVGQDFDLLGTGSTNIRPNDQRSLQHTPHRELRPLFFKIEWSLRLLRVPFAWTIEWASNDEKIRIVKGTCLRHRPPLVGPHRPCKRNNVPNTRASTTAHHVGLSSAPHWAQIAAIPPHVALVGNVPVLPRQGPAVGFPLPRRVFGGTVGKVDGPAAREDHLVTRCVHRVTPLSVLVVP